MADTEQALRDKVAAGYKGGPFYTQPMVSEPIKFVEGIAKESLAGQHAVKVIGTKTSDPHK
jgi:hypothetical protein